ncbi:MAG: hypothetical protein OEQ12_01650 [Nitrosopumilus sp.]|nr:hypothetical protein [Nitrosopumilus sp.]
MKIIDLANPKRVDRDPDETEVLFSSGDFEEQGFLVNRVELRLYVEKTDKKLGLFSLITSFVQTDKGTIEMIYDEGFRGDDSLSRAARFLTSHLGLSSLILRSIISLKNSISD